MSFHHRQNIIELAGCRVHIQRRIVERDGQELRLSAREAELFEYLSERPEQIISRAQLLSDVWGYKATVVTRAVHYTMVRLRKKVEQDPSFPTHLLTVHNRGYRFVPASPEALASAASPSPVADTPPTNLPPQLDTFVGRSDALQALTMHLAGQDVRLVTLLGTAGAGKTRLAMAYGVQALNTFPGGVWFCDLTEVRSLEGLISAVARSLDVTLNEADPKTQLGTLIAGFDQALVILDNFEQLVEHAQVLTEWLGIAPNAKFLVTSRRRLAVAGEHLLDIAPLPLADAVQLFTARAIAAKASFTLNESNRPVVNEIVTRLDCIPLAIELAAARLRILAPRELLERLSQRLAILSGQRRDTRNHHASLEDAIEWSWNLLEPWEQLTLVQCSLFHGSFTLDAVEAVLNLTELEAAPWPLDAVEALVDHSLLRVVEPRPGHVRYQMYVPIHQFASEKLARLLKNSEDIEALRRAYTVHYANYGSESSVMARRSEGGTEHCWSLRFDTENLLVALRVGLRNNAFEASASCALALAEDYALRGPFELGIATLEQVVATPDKHWEDPGLRSKIHLGLGKLYSLQTDLPAAKAHNQLAFSYGQSSGDPALEAKAVHQLGYLCYMMGEFEPASNHYRTALSLAQKTENTRLESVVLANFGICLEKMGKTSQAKHYLAKALKSLRAS